MDPHLYVWFEISSEESPLIFPSLDFIGNCLLFIIDFSSPLVSFGAKFSANVEYFVLFINGRVRNVKFATYLKFATFRNTNKINELR